MKSQRGITLSSLIIYIVVMIMVLGIMARISAVFYKNVNNLDSTTIEISKFNDFNSHFVKEIKSPGNAIDKIQNSYVLFKSGNSFLYQNNNIYFNDLLIVENVKNITFTEVENTIINVSIEFEEYSKEINYKIEEIY